MALQRGRMGQRPGPAGQDGAAACAVSVRSHGNVRSSLVNSFCFSAAVDDANGT